MSRKDYSFSTIRTVIIKQTLQLVYIKEPAISVRKLTWQTRWCREIPSVNWLIISYLITWHKLWSMSSKPHKLYGVLSKERKYNQFWSITSLFRRGSAGPTVIVTLEEKNLHQIIVVTLLRKCALSYFVTYKINFNSCFSKRAKYLFTVKKKEEKKKERKHNLNEQDIILDFILNYQPTFYNIIQPYNIDSRYI